MSVTLEPRTLIKQVPLAIPSHKGIAIQARSETVYNATIPTREEIRHENYQRRSCQLTSQGFKSAINKPYKPIGDTICLDTKKLLLHSLGQSDGCSSSDSSSENESTTNQYQRVSPRQLFTYSPKKSLKNTKKESSDLSTEVQTVSEMIQQVKKGHGLFELALKQQQEKAELAEREKLRQRQLKTTAMRPARLDSESNCSDSDSDSSPQANSNNCLADVNTEMSSVSNICRPFSTSIVINGERTVAIETDKTRGRTSPRRHVVTRPYTPQHNNIATVELDSATDRSSLFRQLCIVHWLLDTMNADPQRLVRPITSCWKAKELMETDAERNRRMNTERTKHDKQELQWKQFISGTTIKERKHRRAAVQLNGQRSLFYHRQQQQQQAAFRRESTSSPVHRRDSVQCTESASRRNSVLLAESPVRRDSVNSSVRSDSSRHDVIHDVIQTHDTLSVCSDATSPLVEDSVSRDDSDSISGRGVINDATLELLNDDNVHEPDVSSVVTMESGVKTLPSDAGVEGRGRIHRNSSSRDATEHSAKQHQQQQQQQLSSADEERLLKKLSYKEKILNKINRMDEETMWQRPKDELSGFRASARVRPKRTSAVLEFEATAPSVEFVSMPQSMKMHFHEVVTEKELILRDKLDALFRERMRKLENKFRHQTTEPCVDIALRSMRDHYLEDVRLRRKNSSKKTQVYHKWYSDLLQAIPDDTRNTWYCQKIVDKLGKYGLLEAGKQSSVKFQRVLSTLRSWELCSPDVSAAIEFCRDRIVEMSVEDYELWFRETFPNIIRPVVVVATDDTKESKADWPVTKYIVSSTANHRAAKSAPPRLRLQL